MPEQLAPIPPLPQRNPNAVDPGPLPSASPNPVGASSVPPVPSGGAPSPEAAPSDFQMQPLVDPNDARYTGKDESRGFVVIGDILTQGLMPWIMATVDVAVGKADSEDFEDVRQAHQIRINALKEEHPDFVSAAEGAAPIVLGALGGSLSKGGSVSKEIAMGTAAGATAGFAQGYTEDVEEPTLSGERFGEGVGGAALGGVVGGAAGAVPAGIKARGRAKARRDQARESAQERTNQFLDKRAKERESAAQKQDKKDTEKQKKESEAKAARQKELASKYKRYKQKPRQQSVHKNFAANMTSFVKNPEGIFRQAASQSPSLTDLSRATGLAPAEIATIMVRRVGKMELSTPAERTLFNQVKEVWDSVKAAGAANFDKAVK